MPPSKPSPKAWGIAVAYAAFAYLLHTYGSTNGFYPRFFWFQLVTHFVSASALALLLLRAGETLSLSRSRSVLLAFVACGAAVGAVGWEVVEYLGVFPSLHWWGVGDSLLDLTMDAVGVTTVLGLSRARSLPVPDVAAGTTPGSAGTDD